MKPKSVLALAVIAAFLLLASVPMASDADSSLKIENAYYQEIDVPGYEGSYVTVEFNQNPNDFGLVGVVLDKDSTEMAKTRVAGVEGNVMSFKLTGKLTSDGAKVTFTNGTLNLSAQVKCMVVYMDDSSVLNTQYLSIGSNVTYTPTKHSYEFLGWYLDSDLTIEWADPVMKTEVLYAKWTDGMPYTIQVKSSGNGTVTSSLTSAFEGDKVTLTVTPNENYVFDEWKNVTPSDLTIKYVSQGKYSFKMPGENVSITASFAKMYDVTVTNDGHGTGSASPSTATPGTTISLSAYPDSGYVFSKWQASGSLSITDDSFIMPSSNVSVKATFAPDEYGIYLDGNGGSSGSAAVKYQATSLSTYDPAVRAGYSLKGYFTSTEGGTKVLNANGSFESSAGYVEGGKWVRIGYTTLYAQWEVNTYTITLDKNGAAQDGSATATYGSQYLKDFNSVTRLGYTLTGYFTAAIGGDLVINSDGTLKANVSTFTDVNGKWIKDADSTLYAQWTAKTAVITLNPNGGTGGSASVTATSGQELPEITLPTKDGFGLRGYYTSATDGTRVIDTYGKLVKSVDGYTDSEGKWLSDSTAVTLYAQWGQILTITYDPCEGTMEKTTDTVVEGLSVNLPTPTRFSYVFKGWFTEATGGEKVDTPYFPKASITLYAHWAEGYVITYDACGGSCKASDTVEKGLAIDLPTPTKTSNVFKGWFTEATGGTEVTSPYTPMAAITLYAHWAEGYVITYDPCGGTCKATDLVEKGKSVDLPTPTRDGFTFKGWYTLATGGTKVESPYTPMAAITLYAQWTIPGEEYTIKIANDGNGSAYPNKEKATAEEVITLTVLPRDGYVFSKWEITAPTALVITKVTDSSYTFIMPDENVEIKALFTPIQYTEVQKVTDKGAVTIPAEVAKAYKISDASKLSLNITKVDKPTQSNIPKDAFTYEISLSYGGKSLTSFSQKIELKINCTDASKDLSKYKMYYVSLDGKTVEDMNSVYKNGAFVFETNHLSTYAASPTVIQPVKEGGDSDNTMMLIIIAIIAIILVIAVVLIIVKKKSHGI